MKEFYIEDDGIKLHAKLDMPHGYTEGSKCPLALVIHGLTGHMEERHIIAVSERINSIGIATLRVEMFGHGSSEGDFERHNLFKWLNNGMTAADYAMDLDFVTDMYIAGHSQGGVTSLMLAGMMPDVFKAAILLAPAVMICEGSREGRAFKQDFDPMNPPAFIWVNDEKKVKGSYLRAAQMLDIDWAISRYKNPVLIVHGEKDEAVPVSCACSTAEKYDDAELVLIPDDNHGYDLHLDMVLDAVGTFLKRVL